MDFAWFFRSIFRSFFGRKFSNNSNYISILLFIGATSPAHDRGEDLVHNYGQLQAFVLINTNYKLMVRRCGHFKISESWIQISKISKLENLKNHVFRWIWHDFFRSIFSNIFRLKIFKQLQLYIDTIVYWGHEPSSRSRGGLGT